MYLVLGIPIILVAGILQTTIISKVLFENGSANLLLITIIIWGLHDRSKGSWILAIISAVLLTSLSSVPFGVYILVFLVINLIVLLIRGKIWKTPFLVLILLVIAGTIIEHAFSYLGLLLTGFNASIGIIFTSVTIPSIILNLFWTFPIFLILNQLLNKLFPSPEEK